MANKVKQSETRTIKRSEITPADYNPRKISPEAKKALKANIKANGLIGGIVFNEQTGNLVSGHQRLTVADEINRYDPADHKNDYDIKVEVVNVDSKKEKELNIFFNSKAVQGEFDYSLLAQMVGDIDVSMAGLDDVDLSYIEMAMPEITDYVVPTYEPQEDKKILAEIQKEEDDQISTETKDLGVDQDDEDEFKQEDNSKTTTSGMTEAEKIAHVKNIKSIVKDGSVYEGEPYFTVSFSSFESKVFFLENLGFEDVQARYIKGEDFNQVIEDYVDSHFEDEDEEDQEDEEILEAEIITE